MAEQPIEDDHHLALEEDDQLVHFNMRDDRQCTADPGDIDKGPEIKEPPGFTQVMDEAIDMIRTFKIQQQDLNLSVIPEMLHDYLENRINCHFALDEFAPLRNFINIIEQYYDGELNKDVTKEEIRNLLRQLCQKVEDIIQGCVVCLLEFEDELQLARLIEELSKIAAKVKSWLQEKFLKKDDVEIAMESANLPHPATVDTIQELFNAVRENLRIHVSITCKQLIDRLTSKSDIVEVTFIVKLGNFPFPPDEKSKARKESLIRQFSNFKQIQKAFINVFQTSEEVQSKKATPGKEKMAEVEESVKQMRLEEEDKSQVSKEKMGAKSEVVEATPEKEKMAEVEESMEQMGLEEEDKSQVSREELGAKGEVFEKGFFGTVFAGSSLHMTEILLERFIQFWPLQYAGVRPVRLESDRFDTESAADNAASSGEPGVQLLQHYYEFLVTTLEFKDLLNPEDEALHELCASCGEFAMFTVDLFNPKLNRREVVHVMFKEVESARKALAKLQAKGYHMVRDAQADLHYQEFLMTFLEFKDLQNPEDGTLKNLCDQYGEVDKVILCNSTAYVEFKEKESASKALADLQDKGYHVSRVGEEPQSKKDMKQDGE